MTKSLLSSSSLPQMRTFPNTPITGMTLKVIAMMTMLVDHFAIVLWPNVSLTQTSLWGGSLLPLPYLIMRLIGRIAFPLFAFLLVEGFLHTHNRKRYAIRLLSLGLVSEIPYDLALHQSWFDLISQNVFFTLFLALGALWLVDDYRQNNPFLGFMGVMGIGLLAEGLHTDYQSFGIGLVIILYVLHDRRYLESLWGSLLCLWEGPTVLVSFFLTCYYNGQRGKGNGHWWYWIYPVHLLVFALIRRLLVE
ncbi:MAG: TraX family protein [Aerococcus sp.]|nr:TraX family protein [Aerococcus sp.]